MPSRRMTIRDHTGAMIHGKVNFGGITQRVGDDLFFSFTEKETKRNHNPLSGRITFEEDNITPKNFQRVGSDVVHNLLYNPHSDISNGRGGLYDAGMERDRYYPLDIF